ncbi:MAG: Xaa-Pro peptidase family protein [Planctomycetota bacterium]|nr:Xaa-Pro peptidase family protein [Planctomycetota bacterium]
MFERPSRRRFLELGAGVAALGPLTACASTAREEETDEETVEQDELFGDLTDETDRYEPISDEERAARRARLGRILGAAGMDALVMEAGATMSYLADVSWGHSERFFGLVVLADGSHFWICPYFEAPRAQLRIENEPGGEIVPWHEHEYAWAPLAAALSARGVERVAVEPRTRLFIQEGLADAYDAARVHSGRGIVRELRGQKDEHELALLRAANELTQQAIGAVAEHLEPGLTDRRLGAWIRRAQQRLGLSGVWVLPLVGADAAYPHGSPSGRVMNAGDVILVDTGGALHGYQSDITRTWVLGGKPSGEVAKVWNVVRDAQKRAYEALRPGPPCSSIDRAAREVIAAAGYGAGYETFAHRLGHGIGLEGHEEPYLDGGNQLPLAPGMTFSDEPGIYIPGRLGVRLEDIVVVTDDGADHFGDWQASPASPA